MASPVFDQTRTIDAYASYYSNITNRLTRMISHDTNCIFSTHVLEVTIAPDSTSSIVVSQGMCFKDDVLIENNGDFEVDFTDKNFYANPGATWFDEVGIYYVFLDYTYTRSKPAPTASFKILKPSQHALFTSQYLFLKAVEVSWNGSTFQIDALYNFDPNATEIKRVYSPTFAGVVDSLPDFSQDLHEAQIIYNRLSDSLWFGTSARWEEFSAIRDRMNTIGCTVGQLGYIGLDGNIYPAIANTNKTLADCVVIQVGERDDGSGMVRLYGRVENPPVESGIFIAIGENLYLSDIEAGSVTNLQPSNFPQCVGSAVSDSTASDWAIWFQPGNAGGGGGSQSLYDFYQDLLQASIFKRLTSDAFVNFDLIDEPNTTATLNPYNEQIEGLVGERSQSQNLTDNDDIVGYDGTCIVACQLCSQGTSQNNQTWWVTNNGNDPIDQEWEPINLNEVHYFSTVNLPVLDSTSVFTIGEIIIGQTSGTTAIVNADYGDYLLLRNLSGTQEFFAGDATSVAEIVIGQTSGSYTSVNGAQINRDNGYTNLKVRCDFEDTSTINDYGILYEINYQIVEYNPVNTRNIETLFADLYSIPHQDNDGLANLTIPLETCKDNLQTFVGSENDLNSLPDYSSTTIINDQDDLKTAISKLDDYIGFTRRSKIVADGDTTPSVLDSNGKQCGILHINNSNPTIITDLDDSTSGILIILMFNDSNTIVEDGTYINLARNADFHSTPDDTLTLAFDNYNNIWTEITRQQIDIQEGIGTLENVTSPSVLGYNTWITDSTSATDITMFIDMYEGQEITIIFTSNLLKMISGATLKLQGGVNFSATADDTIKLVYDGVIWREVSRSVN